ncbi:sugar dehydrogenase [Noviherbaspirillum cavernae]|uniref:Sugar dehydrogenase n=1 Tax=Noviherbaspirillum cavernae TaxID=2320862 RepID=A0A418X5H1_9BURK|nr:sugar dehydrogenase [Noviherbaspirillum cavernae]RJG07734.1 sugar dehydrogenase [Noviherbaspirillum cavernae]
MKQNRQNRNGTLTLSVSLLLAACSGGGGGGDPAPASSGTTASAPAAPVAPAAAAAAASVKRTLEVPSALAEAPFDSERSLLVPPGFGIRLWARVANARFMALAPNGDVLVSVPDEGKVVLLRERANDVPEKFDFATDLRRPHDMALRQIGDTTYLYIAESNRVTRSVYIAGDTRSSVRETVVDNLPDSSTPELGGNYGHELKNLALGADNKLYVSIASSCNACPEDTTSDPVRGAIYQYNADGTAPRLFARGLRNAEGLDFIPGTNTLWVTVNSRDDIAYPFESDFDGDGESDLGRVMPKYVDDNPPDKFTLVRDGGNYGWPFCNPAPNAAMANLDMISDVQFNYNGMHMNCATADRPSRGIRAHAAPLGFSFLQNSSVPAAYRNGAAVAQHGCWNCTSLVAGYKVTYFPFDSAGSAGAEMDLVSGFVTDPQERRFWGRPVDVIADARGRILISDDFAGAIYQLYPLPQ